MNQTEFVRGGYVNEALAIAVIRQCGGWEAFKEMAQDVASHGADAGYGRWTYYADTRRFYAVNRDSILLQLRALAEDLSEDPMAVVRGFRCLKDATESEVGLTLYGKKSQHDTQVANALAWFALEETCRAYCDELERIA